jgi:hypothetical protein
MVKSQGYNLPSWIATTIVGIAFFVAIVILYLSMCATHRSLSYWQPRVSESFSDGTPVVGAAPATALEAEACRSKQITNVDERIGT